MNDTNNPKIQRLFVIGRLLTDKERIEAYKIYDAKTNEVQLISRKKVMNLAKVANPNELVIVGLKRRGKVLDNKGLPVIIENDYLYATKELDKLNGYGEPIKETGKKILIDIKGYQEAATYRVVDSRGKQQWLSQKDFMQLLEEEKIIGAKLYNSGVRVYKYCDTRN